MPLQALHIGKMTTASFGSGDEAAANHLLRAGKYHAALKHLPFNLYVFIGDEEQEGQSVFVEDAKQVLADDPKAVVFIYRENFSEESHTPPTPWILIHRLVQEGALHVLDKEGKLKRRGLQLFIPYEHGNLVERVKAALNISKRDVFNLLHDVLQMRSVRKNLIIIDEEVEVEAVTEVIMLGKLRMDVSGLDEERQGKLLKVRDEFVRGVQDALHRVKPGIYMLSKFDI